MSGHSHDDDEATPREVPRLRRDPTGRHPRHALPDLEAAVAGERDTFDELRPVALGSEPSVEPTRAELDEDYYDRGRDDPQAPRNVDLALRVDCHDRELDAIKAELPSLRRGSRLRRFGVPSLTAVGGAVSAVLVYALAFARDQGDARATAREREAERIQLIRDVRELREHRAADRARIEALTETLRLYFPAGALRLHGPARPEPDQVNP